MHPNDLHYKMLLRVTAVGIHTSQACVATSATDTLTVQPNTGTMPKSVRPVAVFNTCPVTNHTVTVASGSLSARRSEGWKPNPPGEPARSTGDLRQGTSYQHKRSGESVRAADLSVNHFPYLPVVTNPEKNPCVQMVSQIATEM